VENEMSPRPFDRLEAADAETATTAASPMEALLAQLAWVVRRLDHAQYVAERMQGISGSVGGHVRHCLDHVSALVEAASSGRIDYDNRRRGTAVELCRLAALTEIQRVTRDVRAMTALNLQRPVEVASVLDASGTSVVAPSSVGRELAFVVSHTIHHLAVIALLLRDLSIDVPARFGYAPTTPTETATAA
jgi:uncharacterized damage-inducible protein DinB